MKKLFIIVSMIAGLAAWTKAAEVDAGIQKTIDAFDAAWGKHNVKLMAACWLDDGDLINPVGRTATGTAEIEKLFTDEQGTVFKESTIEIKPNTSRTLAEGLVLVDADCNVKHALKEDGTAMDINYHLAIIYKKTDDDWKIVSARPYMFVKH